jgi:hypothetical protein
MGLVALEDKPNVDPLGFFSLSTDRPQGSMKDRIA